MKIHQVVIAAVALCAPGIAYAQEWATPIARDTVLRALVTEALGSNHGVHEQEAAVRAAAERVRPAGALPDPMLSAGVMDLTLPGFAFNRSDFTEFDAELAQEIPWPGTLGARTRVARAARGIAQATLDVRRRDVVSSVATSYYRLRYVVTALATLRRQHELLEAAVQLSTTRYATGLAPQTDPLQAKLARDRLRSEELGLRADSAAALATVNALRARGPRDSLLVAPLDPNSLRTQLASSPSSDSLITVALARHPKLAARRAAVEQATGAIQAERLGGRPDFTLSVRYGYRSTVAGTDLPDFFSAFVGIRLPIWAGRNQHRLADAARFDSTAAAVGLADEELMLGREVTETAARLGASRERLILLADAILPTARGTVESVLRSYQVGRIDFLTLLAVEDAAFRAELEAAAVAGDYQTQLAMLRQLTGEEAAP
jgi:outer membrane protein TolC